MTVSFRRTSVCLALAIAGLAANSGWGATGHQSDGTLATHEKHEHVGGMALADLVEPTGLATFILVAVTAGLGLFRRASPKLLLTWHKRLGPVALGAAVIHATLVILSH